MHSLRFSHFFSFVFVAATVPFGELMAQRDEGDQHIEWIVSVSKLTNGSALVVMNALIDRGWHMYSMNMADDGPVPTTIKFTPGTYRLNGDPQEFGVPLTVFDSTFQMNITWYEDNVVFTQKIQYSEPGSIAGDIEFMVCSSNLCIPGEFKFRQSLP
jgi:DsbC/DsbD-like thiol-disulfide interchange protein